MKQSRIWAWFFLIAIVFFIPSACSASLTVPVPKVIKDVYIYDQDNIIDDETERALNKLLDELEEKTTVEFAVISVRSLLNISIENYANKVFNTLGIGKKDKNNGILLLMSRSDKKVRLEIGRGIESILTDAECKRILLDYFVPYREKDQYTQATEATVMAVLNVLTEKYGVAIDGVKVVPAAKSAKSNFWLWFFLIVIVVVYLYMACKGSGSGSSSSSSDDSDSDFFVSDSGGDSFGGDFGGGGSDGGGASA